MANPTSLLYDLAGSPVIEGCAEMMERCTVCARYAHRGMKYGAWQGSNFTDQNKLKWIAGEMVCEACVWVHSWVAPPGHPPPDEGKRGPCLRHFSHLWSEDAGYEYYTKGDKESIRNWLLQDREDAWWAAIAESGQKHVIPHAVINSPRARPGFVQFDEERVPKPNKELVGLIETVYSIGGTKEEIRTGRWRPRFIADHMNLIRDFEDKIKRIRTSGEFRLALWLAQKQEVEDEQPVAKPKREVRASVGQLDLGF